MLVLVLVCAIFCINSKATADTGTINPTDYNVCGFNELMEYNPDWVYWWDGYKIEPPLTRTEKLFFRDLAQKGGPTNLYISTDDNPDDAEIEVELKYYDVLYRVGDTGIFAMGIKALNEPLVFYVPVKVGEHTDEINVKRQMPIMNLGRDSKTLTGAENCSTDTTETDLSRTTQTENEQPVAIIQESQKSNSDKEDTDKDGGIPISLLILMFALWIWFLFII